MRFRSILCVLALCGPVFADKVVLNDGRTYEGAILEDSDTQVKIKTPKATLTFKRDQVKSVERDSSGAALAEANGKLEALSPDQPELYLEAARWFATDGKEAGDDQVLRRLCNIAAYLNRNQACEANLILGRALLEKGSRADAARAFLRAANADAANAEAKKKSGELKGELEALAKRDLEAICQALDLAIAGAYAEAIPKLRRCRTLMYADRAVELMKTSIDGLSDDLQRRVPCKPCGGKGQAACVPCNGTGIIKCNVCDGSGTKKGFTTGKGGSAGISSGVCRSCCGQGSVLCLPCKGAREVDIALWCPRTAERGSVTVKTEASSWRLDLKREIDLVKYTSVSKEGWVVEGILAKPITAGGIRSCPTCKGVKFDPPPTPPDVKAIQAYREALNDRLTGKTPIEVGGAQGEVYDADVVDDGKFRFRSGKWTE